jgi:hypothetical protein
MPSLELRNPEQLRIIAKATCTSASDGAPLPAPPHRTCNCGAGRIFKSAKDGNLEMLVWKGRSRRQYWCKTSGNGYEI